MTRPPVSRIIDAMPDGWPPPGRIPPGRQIDGRGIAQALADADAMTAESMALSLLGERASHILGVDVHCELLSGPVHNNLARGWVLRYRVDGHAVVQVTDRDLDSAWRRRLTHGADGPRPDDPLAEVSAVAAPRLGQYATSLHAAARGGYA